MRKAIGSAPDPLMPTDTATRCAASAITVQTMPSTGCFMIRRKQRERPQVEAEHQEHHGERRDIEHERGPPLNMPFGADSRYTGAP